MITLPYFYFSFRFWSLTALLRRIYGFLKSSLANNGLQLVKLRLFTACEFKGLFFAVETCNGVINGPSTFKLQPNINFPFNLFLKFLLK